MATVPPDNPVPPPVPSASSPTIDQSLPCSACGVNLQGLPIDGACAACNASIPGSIRAAGFTLPTAAIHATPTLSEEPPPVYVQSEQTCLRCGYSLRGLASEANCPECGSPVLGSLRGNLLRYCGPEYLRTIYTGSLMVQIGALGGIGVGFLAIGGAIALQAAAQSSGINYEIAEAILGAAATITFAIGWWLFASPDPGWMGQDTSAKSRLVLRISSALMALFHAAYLVFVLSGVRTSFNAVFLGGTSTRTFIAKDAVAIAALVCFFLKFFAGVVTFFASTLYIQQVARRIPDARLYKDAKQFMWAGPILYVLCAGIGGIITYVWQMVLINKCRGLLKQARRLADAGGA